jgi:hypothetical protein
MKKYDLQNNRLDQISRNLFKATAVSPEQIEKIVDAPHLFDSVKARIEADERSQPKSKRFLGTWVNLSYWNRQRTAASALAVLTTIFICSAFIIFKMVGK